MTSISTKPPSGMRDFLAADVARRRYAVERIQAAYEAFGFVPLETPTIENLSTLLGKYGPEGDQLLYRLLHRRERLKRALEAGSPNESELSDEGLRYDLTVPLARVVANYPQLPGFYRRYQIQPVWRADRPAKGRFREFYQCDVDVTGTRSRLADAEVCAAVAMALERLGFAEFTIQLNHRELLRALVSDAGIGAELESSALIAIDKLDKVGREGVLAELAERGFGDRGVALLDGLERARAPGFLAARARHDGPGSEGARQLLELLELSSCTPAGPHLCFAPELARGLSYYTGPIFEIQVPQLAGSLGGGGRYDGLIGMFTRRSIPAVGFSLGLERILIVMEERGLFPALVVGAQVLLCRLAGVGDRELLAVAQRLRAGGVRVEVYPEEDKLGVQIAYAAKAGLRYAALVGSEELAAQAVTLKDLSNSQQQTLGLDEAVRRLLHG